MKFMQAVSIMLSSPSLTKIKRKEWGPSSMLMFENIGCTFRWVGAEHGIANAAAGMEAKLLGSDPHISIREEDLKADDWEVVV
jgi:hypothetical protein